ncbi:MAG: ABC transporter ATP-binding protein [Anaerolineales bacterium]
MTTLSVDNLVKRFGDFTAVDGVSFDVRAGEIFGFLGPNGSGKTTTIRMMLGLLPPTEGRIEVLGVDVRSDPAAIRGRVGYMAQRFSLYNDLTVSQNLHFYGRAYGLENAELSERIPAALEMAGLVGREEQRTRDLSGGWRQRLALSAAILHRPEMLFLDEPTAGVDPVSRRVFWELLYGLVEQGVTVFVTTHYMDEAEHCHRLGFIQRGHLIAMGSPSEIKRTMMRGKVLEIDPVNAQGAMANLKQAVQTGKIPLAQVELYGSKLHAVLGDAGGALNQVREALQAEGIEIRSLRTIEPTLEDVFIACMSQ